MILDRLTGALIGLAHAVVGNAHLVNAGTHALVREALSVNAADGNFNEEVIQTLLERLAAEKARLAPGCSSCAHPCGRTDDYDMAQMWTSEAEIRSLKTLLLLSVRSMSAYAVRAAALGRTDAAVDEFFLHALDVLGNEWDRESLLTIVLKAGEMHMRCRNLLCGADTDE